MTQATAEQRVIQTSNSNMGAIVARLQAMFDALYSANSGAGRPASPVVGLIWLDTSAVPWRLKQCISTTTDIVLAYVNATTGDVYVGNADKVDGFDAAQLVGTSVSALVPAQPVMDFTGIPTDAKMIAIAAQSLAADGTDNILLQVGRAAGFDATYSSYTSAIQNAGYSASPFTGGFGLVSGTANFTFSGSLILTKVTGDTWAASGSFAEFVTAGIVETIGGIATLSAPLDRIRVRTAAAANLNANGGSVGVTYWR